MDSRLFLLRRRLREGSRLLRGARLYRGAAPTAFPAAVSVSRARGSGLSRRCGTLGLPTGVQHAGAFGAHAAKPALPILFPELRHCSSSKKLFHSSVFRISYKASIFAEPTTGNFRNLKFGISRLPG